MRIELYPAEDMSTSMRDLATAIQHKYNTGGACLFYGVSPVPPFDVVVFLYPDFTGVWKEDFEDNPSKAIAIDEWPGMILETKMDDNMRYIEGDTILSTATRVPNLKGNPAKKKKMKKSEYLKCKKCSKLDNGSIGTSIKMICPDCNQGKLNHFGKPLAEFCRSCCPTGHGTRWETSDEGE